MSDSKRTAAGLLSSPVVHVLAIAEHRSIGKAAASLHLTQPALSKSVRRLERTLHVPLFERSAQGVVLTRYGESLVRHARQMETAARLALRELDDLRGASRAGIGVAIGPAAPLHLLHNATELFATKLPTHEVTLIDVPASQLLPRLAPGEFDVALVAGAGPDLSAGLEMGTLLADPGVVVIGGAVARGSVDAALAGVQRWVLPPGTRLRRIVERLYERRGLPLPRIARTTSLVLAATMLKARGTASVMPYSWARGAVEGGAARLLVLSEIDWALPVQAIWRAGSATLPTRRFVESLREAASGFTPPAGAFAQESGVR
jgi:DNA-binding transcriptional LysR family regulator